MDKRRHARVDGAGLKARLKIDGELLYGVPVENLSLGGALVAVEPDVPAGKNVLVEILRGNAHAIRLVGRVIARVPAADERSRASIRIRFNPLNPAATNELYELIDDLANNVGAAPDFHSIEIPTEDADIDEILPAEIIESIGEDEKTEVDALRQLLKVREERIAELVELLNAYRDQAREQRARARTLEERVGRTG